MRRRDFLGGLVATGVVSRFSGAQEMNGEPKISLHLADVSSSEPVAAEFVGLSYESAQLANPAFFCEKNAQLIAIFHELAPAGNLRVGGGSSEYTSFESGEAAGAPPFDVFGPDTSKTAKHGTVTSALALRNLRGFLDAVNWSCLYGLNLGQGSVENAVKEAVAVKAILGSRLQAFQIGNEPDSFRRRYRGESYGPADFIAEWRIFHDAIARAVPTASFAGPDISNKLPYLTAFAEEARKHKDVVLLTSHYYAMGPAGNPDATLDNLLDPDPKLTTLKRRDLHLIQEACETAGLPYRMSEGNSCWDGGKAGVSDTFASALWCADYMLTCMGRGWKGVNLHGGGNGLYTPIAGSPSTGFERRPEFFGMRFAQHFVGARRVETTLAGADPRVAGYAFERDGGRELVLINKTAGSATCQLSVELMARPLFTLSAPAIDAKSGVTIVNAREGSATAAITVPAYSATAYTLIRVTDANRTTGA